MRMPAGTSSLTLPIAISNRPRASWMRARRRLGRRDEVGPDGIRRRVDGVASLAVGERHDVVHGVAQKAPVAHHAV